MKKEEKTRILNIEPEVEEYEIKEINKPTQPTNGSLSAILRKGMVAAMLGLTLATGASIIPVTDQYVTVEAASKKKDKKKPKFTFKGKTKMTVTKGKSVKIPKVTAKDNKDGNVTKKIKVVVKKGKKSYSSIANKIKNNKSVKFTATGKYIVTYSVTDKAGNKATKKRTITVKAPSKTNNTAPTTEATTEKATTEQPTTETPTTEATTTEQPTTETPTPETPTTPEVTYTEVIVNGQTFKVTDADSLYQEIVGNTTTANSPVVTIQSDYSDLYFEKASGLLTNSQYLQYLSSITAKDVNGIDISNNIVIYELNLKEGANYNSSATEPIIYIYVKDSKGNAVSIPLTIHFQNFPTGLIEYGPDTFAEQGLTYLSGSPVVYGKLRTQALTQTSSMLSTSKKLELVRE